ncbi:hypothetical protein [Streptomyces lanatus]|uniref:Uncharacterized protein n=1 Tax=Streptomyces lanatus TaxID=66900 RepID=A0ABV1XJI4_9ACTN|nr:hypothetical protein [Streptomyces lanatus]GHG95111.1 hypothetical protein GCM10018780_18260 [Streptomyces lanatus]
MGVRADGPRARGSAWEDSATEPSAPDAPTTRLFGARGRHRRPRPRKVVLAAGGLALAAGALSLVRQTTDPTVTGLAAPESDPTPDLGAETEADRSTNAAATVPTTAPRPDPSATSAMGGLGTTPTSGTIVVPTRHTTATPRPGTPVPPTTAPQKHTPAPHPPATTPQAPQQTPPPGRTTSPPSPRPTQPDDDPVCIPVIGLCVDSVTADD